MKKTLNSLLAVVLFSFMSSIAFAQSVFDQKVDAQYLRNHPITKNYEFPIQDDGTVFLVDAARIQGVPMDLLIAAFTRFDQNLTKINNKNYVTISDFTKPSSEIRQFAINLVTGVVDKLLVAHGVNTGGLNATCFSNVEDSRKSSLGFYLTGTTYQGKNGYSLNLHGQDKTNSNAYTRRIVIHGADYVSEQYVKDNGRLGRSWGCPAVNRKFNDTLINRLKNGSLFYIHGINSCGN